MDLSRLLPSHHGRVFGVSARRNLEGDFPTDTMLMNTAYILIPALPFAVFLIIALGSRWVGEASHRLTIPAVSASFILSVLACIDVVRKTEPGRSRCMPGSHPAVMTVEAGFCVDAVTVILLLLVTGVSSLVHIFSSRYMQADPRYARFFALISLFTSAMVMLVMGANLFMLFMFWEIMGLCSYSSFPIGQPSSGLRCRDESLLVNGVADVGLAFGITLTWATFGTLDIQAILSAAPRYANQTVNLLGWFGLEGGSHPLRDCVLLLFMGLIGRPAQIPPRLAPICDGSPTPAPRR